LRDEFSSKPIDAYTSDSFAQIYQQFFDKKKEVPLPHMWSIFLRDLMEFVMAISRVIGREWQKKDEVPPGGSYGTFTPGEIWNLWVNSITTVIRDENLPYKVRKDTDKHTGNNSPFVRLIKEIQNSLPKEFRMFTHSDDALAQAIHRARRNVDFGDPENRTDLSKLIYGSQ
jgi:hypothetical protein